MEKYLQQKVNNQNMKKLADRMVFESYSDEKPYVGDRNIWDDD